MTDLEKFVDLYKSFGIDLEKNKDDNMTTIKMSSRNKEFGGYLYLYSIVQFDKDGKFIKQYFYE